MGAPADPCQKLKEKEGFIPVDKERCPRLVVRLISLSHAPADIAYFTSCTRTHGFCNEDPKVSKSYSMETTCVFKE